MLLTHRYYDPTEGRFLTRDSIGYAGGMNLYGYCGGNPVGRLDPSGLYWTIEDWKNWFIACHYAKPVIIDQWDQGFKNNAEFWGGMGDHISLGLTKLYKAQLGLDDYASTKSDLYKAGAYTGYAWDVANYGALAIKAVGVGIAIKQAWTAESIALGPWNEGALKLFAEQQGRSTYLNIYPKIKYLYSWTANKCFLKIARIRGLKINFSINPKSAEEGGTYIKEIQWLERNGYQF